MRGALAPGARIVAWRPDDKLTDERLRADHGLAVVHRETTRSRFLDLDLHWLELAEA